MESPGFETDEQMLEVRPVDITGSRSGDVMGVSHLSDRVPAEQEIGSGEPPYANGACNAGECLDAISGRGAPFVTPSAGTAGLEKRASLRATRLCGP